MSAPSWLTRQPIAHRGLHDAAKGIVENSPSAIEAAADAGFSVELDVRVTADGDAAVFHDGNLERLTGVRSLVVDHTMDELRQIAYRESSDHIASLGDVLDLIGGRVPLVVEVKNTSAHEGKVERRIADLLNAYTGDVAVMSFDPRSISLLRRMAPKLPRGIVACSFTNRDVWSDFTSAQLFIMRHFLHLPFTRPDFISYDIDELPSAKVRLLRALGLTVICWTVRSEEQQRLAGRWTDQITFEGFVPDRS